jgi:hypothetical protein
MAADLLGTIRAEIDARMAELRPLLAEYEGLLAAANVLVAQGGREIPGADRHRAAIAPAGKRATRGRKAAGGDRASAGRTGGARVRLPEGAGRRGPLSAAAKAILAALEHGSHTVAELVVVTAQSDNEARANLRVLLARGVAVRVSRQGKTAYALAAAS